MNKILGSMYLFYPRVRVKIASRLGKKQTKGNIKPPFVTLQKNRIIVGFEPADQLH